VNVARLLWETAADAPSRIAIQDGIACARLRRPRRARGGDPRCARRERDRPGDRVAILLPHGADSAAAFYGATAAGAVATVINWLYRPRQVEAVLEHAAVSVLVTTREWAALQTRPLEGAARLLFVEDIPAVGAGGPIDADGASPAQITYTSGSSGGPKGVVMSHDNLLAGIRTVVRYLGITAEDRIASVLPFSFVYGFNQLNCAIATAARLDIMTATMGGELVKSLEAAETTVLAGVPPIWMQLLKTPAFQTPLPSLRIATCAGGRLSPEAVRACPRRATAGAAVPHVRAHGGLPEHLPPAGRGRRAPGFDGTRRAGVARLCGAGGRHHRGRRRGGGTGACRPTVALGYWNDPETSAKVFRPNPTAEVADPSLARAVYSGDLVRRDPEGRLYYVGRRDRMIKTLGFRVSPDEIADVLYASKQVTEAVVTAEPDEVRVERIVAHVVLAAGRNARAAPSLVRGGAPAPHAAGALGCPGLTAEECGRKVRPRGARRGDEVGVARVPHPGVPRGVAGALHCRRRLTAGSGSRRAFHSSLWTERS
jgi:acyl-CoA synthetase (AMP-forming)/AMP-acid ligase II